VKVQATDGFTKVGSGNSTLQIEQGSEGLDLRSESSFARACDLHPRACSLALVTFSDRHKSMMFQDFNVLAKIAVRKFESRFQIREICLLGFAQHN